MENKTDPPSPPEDTVWHYRGYQLKSSEFNNAMIHLYRGEVTRSNIWRQRLDNTTNWAVITAGAAISFALGSPTNHHGVILLNTMLITLFLYLEARRYRYYELFASRVRLMETDFFAAMLVPPFAPSEDWAESLTENLLQPRFTISMWEAFGRRFRRNYMWIYVVLAVTWILKNVLFPEPATTWEQFTSRAALGTISGEAMILIGFVFNGLLFAIGIATIGLQHATGEVLPRYTQSAFAQSLSNIFERGAKGTTPSGPRAWFRRSSKRAQLVSLIVTEQSETLSKALLAELKRGVTRLEGTGMYTGQPHHVLMVALTLTEVNHLKSIVSQSDPRAFVMVMPAQEVLGLGFQTLKQEPASAKA